MAKFPEPPDVAFLRALTPVTQNIPAGTVVARIFFSSGDHPTTWDAFRYFGPTNSRFDHQLCDKNNQPFFQERGIMYLAVGAESIPTCLAEVFQTVRIIDRFAKNPILTGFELAESINLLDLSGPFCTAVGASTAINSGSRIRARRWAQQFYAAYPEIDGILYGSSMYGNSPAIALFERAARAIPSRPVFHRALQDSLLDNVLTETARKINYNLI